MARPSYFSDETPPRPASEGEASVAAAARSSQGAACLVVGWQALDGSPKLQAIFTLAKSSGREFDLKEAARWGHHGYLGELWRELPDFAPRPLLAAKSA